MAHNTSQDDDMVLEEDGLSITLFLSTSRTAVTAYLAQKYLQHHHLQAQIFVHDGKMDLPAGL